MDDKIIVTPIEARIILDKCNKCKGNVVLTTRSTAIGDILYCTPQDNIEGDISTWENITDYDSW